MESKFTGVCLEIVVFHLKINVSVCSKSMLLEPLFKKETNLGNVYFWKVMKLLEQVQKSAEGMKNKGLELIHGVENLCLNASMALTVLAVHPKVTCNTYAHYL